MTKNHSEIPNSHDRVGQKVDPDPVPPDAVLLDDLILVGNPVEVPPVESSRVVDAKHVDRLDFKVGSFELYLSADAPCYTADGKS